MVKTMTRSLQTARDNIDINHQEWFQTVCDIANRVEAPIMAYRTCNSKRYRNNAPSSDVSSHYKINVSIPFLDHLLEALLSRFSAENCIAFNGLSIVPAIIKSEYSEN